MNVIMWGAQQKKSEKGLGKVKIFGDKLVGHKKY